MFNYSKKYSSLTRETTLKAAVNMEDLTCFFETSVTWHILPYWLKNVLPNNLCTTLIVTILWTHFSRHIALCTVLRLHYSKFSRTLNLKLHQRKWFSLSQCPYGHERSVRHSRPLHFVSMACELFLCQRYCHSVVHFVFKRMEEPSNIAGVYSEEIQADFGLPQGSWFGPLLFTVYTVPMENISQKYGICYHLYADDCQLYIPFDPPVPDDLENTLPRLIVLKWLSEAI